MHSVSQCLLITFSLLVTYYLTYETVVLYENYYKLHESSYSTGIYSKVKKRIMATINLTVPPSC